MELATLGVPPTTRMSQVLTGCYVCSRHVTQSSLAMRVSLHWMAYKLNRTKTVVVNSDESFPLRMFETRKCPKT